VNDAVNIDIWINMHMKEGDDNIEMNLREVGWEDMDWLLRMR
jgi:hypothetical protein